MEKTTNLKTRALALILTVLMIVGVLPMTVFALTPAENSTPTSNYRVETDFDGVISNLWNSDSKYWTLAMTSSNPSLLPSYSTKYNGGRTWNGGNCANDTIIIPATTDGTNPRYMLGHTRSPSFNDSEYALIFSQNTAGIDFAYKFDLTIDASMADVATEGVFMFGPAFVATEGLRYDTLRVKVSGEVGARKYELYWPAGYAEDFATKLGNKICDLEVGKSYNIKALYDISHKDDKSYVCFVWIDGEFVGATNPNNGASASYGTDIYSGANRQAGYNTTAGTNYANGPMLFGFDFESKGALAWTASNFDLYLYDDTPDDGDVRNSTRSKQFVFYNDYNSLTVGADYSATGLRKNYVGNVYQSYTDKGGNKISVVADSDGDNAIKMNAKGESWYDVSFGSAGTSYASNSGKSFVLQFDIKADGLGSSGPLFNFGDRGRAMGAGKYEIGIMPIMRDLDGSLYVGYKDGAVFNSWAVTNDGKTTSGNNYGGYSNKALADKYKTGGFLTKITADKYTNIAVFVNVEENYFTIYVDGVDKTGKLNLLDDLAKQRVLDAGFANGYAVTESRMLYNHVGKDVYLDNVTGYFADAPAFNTIDAEIKTGYVAPTTGQISAMYTEDSTFEMRYYNDFNAATVGTMNTTLPAAQAATNISPSISAGITWVDDGNGGAAAKWRATARNTYLNLHGRTTGDRMGTPDSGKSFVFSMDIKGGDTYAETPLVVFSTHSFFVEAVQSGNNANYCPIYVGSDGLYLGYDGTAMINTQGKFAISAAGVKTAENKILTLSKDEFVNIAVAVNVPNNTWSLYVDGVCVRQDLTFINPEHLGENNSNVNTAYANGYGLAYARIHQNESSVYTSADGITIDNVTIYNAASFKATADRCVVSQLYDGDTATGYKYENGGIYYYEKGAIVTDKVTPDGILTINENGQVFYGETAVTRMDAYYKNVNGDIVPVDGIYNGFYTASIILGESIGNVYYYDADGNRIVNQECYAVGDVPYTFDANGARGFYDGTYNGKLYENSALVNGLVGDKLYVDGELANGDIDGIYYVDGAPANGIFSNKNYVDGIVQKNGLQHVGEDIYYAGADGAFQTGTYKIDGVYYEFDAETYKGTVKEAGEVVDNIANATTGKVYESVADALEEASDGDKVTVSEDVTIAEDITIGSKVTLDLNGKTVTANGIVTIFNGSGIVDNGAEKGLLKAEKTDVLYTGDKTADSIILYNEAKEGYQVAKVKKQDSFTADETGDGFVLMFRPSLDSNTAYNMEMFAGMDADDDIQFILQLRTSDGTAIRTFVLDSDYVAGAYADNKAMKITVRGAKHNYAGQELTVYYMLYSRTTGMECQMYAGSITPTADTPAEAE